MRANVDVQNRTMRVPQGRSRLCVMSIFGAVCHHRASDPTGQEAEHGGSNGDGEAQAQAAAGESKGGKTIDATDIIEATGERENMEKREGGREQTLKPHMMTRGAARRGADNKTTATMEGERKEGNKMEHNPNPEDLCLREVYGDWVHANPRTHLNGNISDDAVCQAWWRDLDSAR